MRELDEQGRLERNNYIREWRRKHPDRVREANKKYWARRAAKKAQEKKEAEADEAQGG